MKVYSVYDGKVGFYDKPFILRNKADALRGWQDVANDKNTMIGKFPHDYTLFEIGEWDEIRGIMVMYDSKVSLGGAHEFHREGPQPVAM